MSELVPNYKWNEVRKLTLEQLRELPCCEMTDDEGNTMPLGVFLMVPSNEYPKALTDAKGMSSNSIIPLPFKKPEDFIKEEVKEVDGLTCPECGKSCASQFGLKAHQRSHKK